METKELFYDYIERIDKIDEILKGPVQSLIAFTEKIAVQSSGLQGVLQLPLYFPPWLAEDRNFPKTELSATTALCCATLQRLWSRRRRFSGWDSLLEVLEKKLCKKVGGNDQDRLPDLMAQAFLPLRDPSGGGESYLKLLQRSDLLGKRRPLLACETLWILIHAGEGAAYSGSAFLSCFGVLWALRHRPGPLTAGAAVGLAPPTAYITARCLLPVRELARACTRRASLLDKVRGILTTIDELDAEDLPVKLPFKVDELATALYDYSDLSLGRSIFERCAKQLETRTRGMSFASDAAKEWRDVREDLRNALQEFGKAGKPVIDDAAPVMDGEKGILRRICDLVAQGNADELKKLGVEVLRPDFRDYQSIRPFWDRQSEAAEEAYKVCRTGFEQLDKACQSAAAFSSLEVGELCNLLRALAEANRVVAKALTDSIQDSIQWCENAMLREIAHSSADNLTNFDPAELVSGLAVAVYAQSITSPLRLADAVEKALKGAQADGSWMPGRPFRIDEEGGFGETAPTAGIIWMLSGAIARNRHVTAADDALARYVEWLEATQTQIAVPVPGAKDGDPKDRVVTVCGWASERTLSSQRVDLWTTIFAINSLINIRGLMEHRLWEVCRQRFTVIPPKFFLSGLDPVDLGACHEHRLQYKLARMSREAEGPAWKTADYAVVLHGPPGSSKTALAQALAQHMWRASLHVDGINPRLVRITPADFTRGGEERLDSEARIIFDILSHIRNVTILFDEIDDLLRERTPKEKPSFLKIVVPAMLNRLQDLRDACPRQQIAFILATNYVEKIEPALIRKGRIDQALPVVYPDAKSRAAIISAHIKKLPKEQDRWAQELKSRLNPELLNETQGWPWLTLDAMLKTLDKEIKNFSTETKDEEGKQKISDTIDGYKASVSENRYNDRLERSPASAELRNEILYDMFSRATDLKGYIDGLRERIAEKPHEEVERMVKQAEKLWASQGR